ncbi:carbohydrate-binding module family 48 protein [Ophiostoma piceae UAMH 11346]|uniref:Carbohydrate-binding module family 48 protein n=1 Tax=Ophiostoma piceae (strain UAMH 11346) TaxID=1262450 RepID=S3C817_OPHP1|nr:carbohydrate-binding module family 48 protein [Ophiostoma piceae UAMH 11346]
MGNNASSPKADGSGSASPGGRSSLHHPHQHHSHSQHYQNNHQHQQQSQQYQQHNQSQSQQQQKGPARNPALVQNQRVAAAPPEQSMAQAQGSTTSSSVSRSIPSRPYTTAAEAAVAASASPSRNATSASTATSPKPTPMASNTTPPPSKPVAVPQSSSSTSGPGIATIPIATPAAVAATTNAYAAEHVEQAAPRPLDYDPPLSPYTDSMDVPMMAHNSMQDVSYLTRPPRLPLPIEEEVHTPGSPIIAPAKEGEPIDDIEALDNEGLTHRSSTLSSVVNEEDEEELRVDKTRPTVPTRLEWLRGGEKVYVTGTIFQWNKKQRMHPVEGRPGVFATTINVLPGTHHIRFLVDNQMETSRDLPTTVDFGNNLVNYIEVAPQSTPPKEYPGVPPPAALGAPVWKDVPEASAFSHDLPQYLVDYDQPDESPDFHSAAVATEILSMPPSLPGFLGKPILNAATLIKDDNSVLNMPNYTILNHLATSSIKNNILAVSATTRYKAKFVTIIIYKPTGGDDKH